MTTDGDSLVELARGAEHRAELRDTVERLLAKEWSAERSRDLLETDGPTWAVELWEQLHALGWADLLVDGSVADFCVVSEAIGASTAPVPFVTAAVATWMGAVPPDDGGITVVVPGCFTARAQGDEAIVLTGDELLVPYANVATRLVVHGRAEDDDDDVVVAFGDDAAGLHREPLRPLDVMPSATVVLDDVRPVTDSVLASGTRAAALAHEAGLRLVLGWTAELTGVAAAASAAAVDYACERVAFGRPIGAFQAIKHRLVDQRAAIEVSRALIGRAAMALDAGAGDRGALVSLAAFWAADALPRVPEGAVQVFGGIGYTWEHVAHVYLRRAAVLTALLGRRDEHRDVVAEWLGHR